MADEAFVDNATDSATESIAPTPKLKTEGRSTLRVLLISDEAEFVDATVFELHDRGFAEVGAWSRLLAGPNPGEVMRILTKRRRRTTEG